jgi:chromosome segregation ATPase
MGYEMEEDTETLHDYLAQLEVRYEATREALACATGNYHALRELPDASERQVQRAMHHILQLRKQLEALRSAIERVEAQQDAPYPVNLVRDLERHAPRSSRTSN